MTIDWTNEEARNAAIQEMIEAEVSGLKTKNSELLGKVGKLKEFEGVDPEEYRTLKQQREENERKAAMARGDFEKLTEKLKGEHKTELEKLTAREKTLLGTIDKALREAAAVKAIADAGGNATLLLPHVLSATKLEEKDGEFSLIVTDTDGLPLEGGLSALMTKFQSAEVFQGAFASKAATGTGATSVNNPNGGVVNPYAKDSFNMTEQARLEKSDPGLAKQLREQAKSAK